MQVSLGSIGQMFYELIVTVEHVELMLAETIAQLPSVNSAVVVSAETLTTEIGVFTFANPSGDDLSGISGKCTNHWIFTTRDDFQSGVCIVVSEDGALLATYESGT